jgi:phosphohistidine phosphatase SixA
MNRVSFLALSLSLLAPPLFFAVLPQQAQVPGIDNHLAQECVTVIAVRHAEKDRTERKDPKLTEAGVMRARELSRMLASSGVTHIYSTPYRRTRATVAPTAEAMKLEIQEYSPRDLSGFAKQLAGLPPGSVALVAGHSNTTPSLVLALGGDIAELESLDGVPALGDTQYDRLFVTTLPPAGHRAKTIELRFGKETK